ncbi:MAG: hypothetical protein ACXW1U_16470 [Methylobacter sp.]
MFAACLWGGYSGGVMAMIDPTMNNFMNSVEQSYHDKEKWRQGFNRYEKLRKLDPRRFEELYRENLRTNTPFDELVDRL